MVTSGEKSQSELPFDPERELVNAASDAALDSVFEGFYQSTQSVSHYTDLVGLKGIIETKSIRLSDVEFMNDGTELKHGQEILSDVLEEKLADIDKSSFAARALTGAKKKINEGYSNRIYAMCFCAESNLLSQWRGYSGQGVGISIEFGAAVLNRDMVPGRSRLMKVVYDDKQKVDQFRRMLQSFVESIRAIEPDKQTESLLESLILEIRFLGEYFIPIMKDAAFREEQEWRLITGHSRSRLIRLMMNSEFSLKHTVRRGIVVPYIELKRKNPPRKEGETDQHYEMTQFFTPKLPINRIIVGPSAAKELVASGVRDLLENRAMRGSW